MPIEIASQELSEYLRETLSGLYKAQESWRQTSVKDRIQRILTLKSVIKDHTDELVAVMGKYGKPELEVLVNEISVVLRVIDYYCSIARGVLNRDIPKNKIARLFFPFKKFSVVYEPYGVFGMLPAWNYPFQFTFGDAVPALLAGNAVIAKPSELVSDEMLELMRKIVRKAGLENLFQIIEGGPHTGGWLTDHCDGIHFTGSSRTGLAIQRSCQKRGIPFIGEMGGSDAMIVFPDCDIERAVNAAVWGRFMNSGQNCNAVKKIYYVGSEAQAKMFACEVAEAALKLRDGIDYGPVVGEEQFNVLESQVLDALGKGAEPLTLMPGLLRRVLNEVEGPNWFFPPVVLFIKENRNAMRICYEETFGPILPVISLFDETEAVKEINDNRYALGCSIWTNNDFRAKRLAGELDVANVVIRDVLANYAVPELPFGGRRDSGTGSRHGVEGLLGFARPKSVFTAPKRGRAREDYWFPYGRKVTPLGIVQEKLFRILIKHLF